MSTFPTPFSERRCSFAVVDSPLFFHPEGSHEAPSVPSRSLPLALKILRRQGTEKGSTEPDQPASNRDALGRPRSLEKPSTIAPSQP